jgi:acyl-coenzyme A synthetase/AMP-(fatty) acid ligase
MLPPTRLDFVAHFTRTTPRKLADCRPALIIAESELLALVSATRSSMQRRYVEVVASLPRTASGKIQKHLLRASYRP